MTRTAWILTVATIAVMTVSRADAEMAACYELQEPAGGIGAMTVTAGGALTYAEVGQPYVLFQDHCDLLENGTSTCALECDGGRLHFTHSAAGVLVEAEGRRVETMRFESLLNLSASPDVDGWGLDGRWTLVPADASVCREMENRAPDIALEPGDMHPWVADLEAYLLAGGLFLDGPDMVYDGQTAEAVKLYQRELGLEPSGTADRNLLRRIAADAVLAFGGC